MDVWVWACIYLGIGLIIGMIGVVFASDPWDVAVEGAHPLIQILLIAIFWGLGIVVLIIDRLFGWMIYAD